MKLTHFKLVEGALHATDSNGNVLKLIISKSGVLCHCCELVSAGRFVSAAADRELSREIGFVYSHFHRTGELPPVDTELPDEAEAAPESASRFFDKHAGDMTVGFDPEEQAAFFSFSGDCYFFRSDISREIRDTLTRILDEWPGEPAAGADTSAGDDRSVEAVVDNHAGIADQIVGIADYWEKRLDDAGENDVAERDAAIRGALANLSKLAWVVSILANRLTRLENTAVPHALLARLKALETDQSLRQAVAEYSRQSERRDEALEKRLAEVVAWSQAVDIIQRRHADKLAEVEKRNA